MDYEEAGLSSGEYGRIKEILGRVPNDLETELISAMWPDRYGFKSVRSLFARFPQQREYIDCHGGWGLALKIGRRNRPSTGVSGVIRDILAAGTKPAALMDGLFLGIPDSEKSRALTNGIVEGISDYGNALGIPTIGGKTFYDPCFEDNSPVNIFSCGFVRLDNIADSRSARPGDKVALLGSKTGRDGAAEAQTGGPFEEKLLLECCLELLDKGLIVSMRNMSAAGILSLSGEIARESGTGIRIVCDSIPRRSEPAPQGIFIGEPREGMLLIIEDNKFGDAEAVADYWGLECAVLGQVTDDGRYRVELGGETIADLPVAMPGDASATDLPMQPPDNLEERSSQPAGLKSADPAADLLELVGSVHGSSRREIWTQYDCQVQLRTATEPGGAVSALRIPDSDSLVAFAMEAEPWKCSTDARAGAMETMASSIRALALFGADLLGTAICLNFPPPESPKKPENYFVLSECVDGLAEVCRDMECPVVSGNVSQWEETLNGAACAIPLVVTAGCVSHWTYMVTGGHAGEGDDIFLVGPMAGSLGASRWQVLFSECGSGASGSVAARGSTWKYDAEAEREFIVRALLSSRKADIKKSARVIAGGGLAVALAKEAICAGIGMTIDIAGCDATEALFSEGGPRAVYIIPPYSSEKFLACWDGYPVTKLGVMGGASLIVKDVLDVPCAELKDAYTRKRLS